MPYGPVEPYSIKHTLAVILGQAAAPTLDSDIMCERSDDALSPCFNAGEGDYTYSDRLRLSATGVALRPWAEFGDAAFVSMFAQAWKSSQLDLGDRQVCAYPALHDTIAAAVQIDDVGGGGDSPAAHEALAWDLRQAWHRQVLDTQRAFPAEAQRGPKQPAEWLALTGGKLCNIGLLQHLEKIQRTLSQTCVVLFRRGVDTAMHEDRTYGWAERLQLYGATQTKESNAFTRAMPWLDDGDLHISNSDYLIATSLRYVLEPPATLMPQRLCPCKDFVGMQTVLIDVDASPDSRAHNAAAMRQWARHALTCSKGGGRRTRVHDAIQDVLIVMLEEAGFQQVREEDVWWDILATYHDKDHRRPDITCVDPLTNTTYILDVVIAWGETMGLAADSSSRLANAKEAWKRRRYRRAFWAKVREGWTAAEAVKWADAEEERREATEAAMDAVIGEQRHVFVPLGFEANGAYGAATRDFFRVIERAVEAAAARDHYHWSAPSWREHWRQRVDVALAKGQAGLVSSAVKASRNRGKKQAAKQRRRNKASPEWSPTDCSPSAPQQG
jgi:hypothetical protein